MSRFATGVTVVTTFDGEKREGVTVNSFSSLSLDPPLVLWSLRNNAPSRRTFERALSFAVNVLAATHCDLSRHFATSQADKFAGIDFTEGILGSPILAGNLALFQCRTIRQVEAGDHQIFIGEVLQSTYRDDVPLIFSGGRYCIPTAMQ